MVFLRFFKHTCSRQNLFDKLSHPLRCDQVLIVQIFNHQLQHNYCTWCKMHIWNDPALFSTVALYNNAIFTITLLALLFS